MERVEMTEYPSPPVFKGERREEKKRGSSWINRNDRIHRWHPFSLYELSVPICHIYLFFFVLRSTRSENGSAEEHQRSVSLNFGCNSLEIQRRPFYCSCKNKGWEKKGNGGKKEERGDWREVCVQRKNARKSADFTMRLDRR